MNKQDSLNNKKTLAENKNGTTEFVDMETLLNNLKNEDAKNLLSVKRFKGIFYVLIIFYILLLVVNPDPDLKIYDRITGLCYVAAFTLFAILSRKSHRELRKIDYALSSSEMFARAAKRYSFSLSRYLYAVPSLILLDAGFTISEYFRWVTIEPLVRILIVQAIFIPILLISGYIGYLVWRKRQKPLYEGAMLMLKELNES